LRKERKVEEIPEEFKTYEEAAEFWDAHDSTNYKHLLEEVKMEVDIQKRHYLIEIDKDTAKVLHENAQRKGISASSLASEILQKQLVGMK